MIEEFTKNLKKLTYDSAFVASSDFYRKGIPFLLLPILTYYLSPSEYGMISYAVSIALIVSVFLGLQPQTFISSQWNNLHEKDKKRLLPTILFFALIVFSAIFFLSLITLFTNQNNNTINFGTMIIILIIAFGLVLLNMLTGLYQAKKNFKSIAGYVILFTSVHYLVGIILLIQFSLSWYSILIGQSFASLLIFIIFTLNNKDTIFIFKPSTNLMKKYITFGMPLLVHGLTIVVIGNIDRLMITNILSSQDNGIYSVAYMIGMLVGVLHESLAKIWNPYFYERVSSTKGKAQILNFRLFYIAFSILLLIIMYFFAPAIFVFLVDESYFEGSKIIPIILLSYTFESIRKLYVVNLFFYSKVKIVALIGIFGAIINVVLNFLWLNIYGITGAAYATLASFFITALLTFVSSHIIDHSRTKNES